VIQLLSALLTPLIAVITTLIAIQQWRLARLRWRLDLYDKRFETYRAVAEFISHICINGDCTKQERVNFLRSASRNCFLFGPDVQQLIDEIYRQSVERSHLEQAIQDARGQSQEAHRGQLAQKVSEIDRWFLAQLDVVKKCFGLYLEIHQR
jgi:hypothetical protein